MYHGGNNGLHEALYHGVPLVVVPILADQHDTATRVVERGMGLRITRHDVSKNRVVEALREVLNNKRCVVRVYTFVLELLKAILYTFNNYYWACRRSIIKQLLSLNLIWN